MRTNEVPRFEEAFSSSEGSSGRRRRSSCVVDANHRTSASARAPMGGRRQRMVERAASRCRRGRGSWSWSVRSREGRTCERFAVKHGRRVSRRPVRGVVRIEASHRDGASSGSRRPSAGCACRDGAAEGVPSFKVCRLSQRKSARASSPMTDANIFLVISSIQLCSASRHHEPGWARAVSSAPSAWARLGILARVKTRTVLSFELASQAARRHRVASVPTSRRVGFDGFLATLLLDARAPLRCRRPCDR